MKDVWMERSLGDDSVICVSGSMDVGYCWSKVVV